MVGKKYISLRFISLYLLSINRLKIYKNIKFQQVNLFPESYLSNGTDNAYIEVTDKDDVYHDVRNALVREDRNTHSDSKVVERRRS